jgi:hypothetical protein
VCAQLSTAQESFRVVEGLMLLPTDLECQQAYMRLCVYHHHILQFILKIKQLKHAVDSCNLTRASERYTKRTSRQYPNIYIRHIGNMCLMIVAPRRRSIWKSSKRRPRFRSRSRQPRTISSRISGRACSRQWAWLAKRVSVSDLSYLKGLSSYSIFSGV